MSYSSWLVFHLTSFESAFHVNFLVDNNNALAWHERWLRIQPYCSWTSHSEPSMPSLVHACKTNCDGFNEMSAKLFSLSRMISRKPLNWATRLRSSIRANYFS